MSEAIRTNAALEGPLPLGRGTKWGNNELWMLWRLGGSGVNIRGQWCAGVQCHWGGAQSVKIRGFGCSGCLEALE